MERSRQQARKQAPDDRVAAKEPAPERPAAEDSARPGADRPQAPDRSLDYDYSNFFWGSGDDVFDIIEPFDESLLNPNSYNLRLHDELIVYEELILDMKRPNRFRRPSVPDAISSGKGAASFLPPSSHTRGDGGL